MSDISVDLGNLTVGIDLPFIEAPSTTVGVGAYIPVTPTVSVGGALELNARPQAIDFDLRVGVKLIQLLELKYTVKTWTVQNPLLRPEIQFPVPPPIPPPIETPSPDGGFSRVFTEAGTLSIQFYRVYTEGVGESGYTGGISYIISPGDVLTVQQDEPPFGNDYRCEIGFGYNGNVNGTGRFSYCQRGFQPGLGIYKEYFASTFVPNGGGTIDIGFFLPPSDDMSCTCAEIDALLAVRLTAFQDAIIQALSCVNEDTRALRISFQGEPQTSVASYQIAGNGVTTPLPGDALQFELTPASLPAGENEWLTEPKLYQLAVIIPVYDDGKYGAPLSVVAPFGNACRVFIQFAGVRQFAYSLLPNVVCNFDVTWQTGANLERPEWCQI